LLVTAGVLIAAISVAACGSSSNSVTNQATKYGTILYGKLPTTGTPVSGGTITAAQLTGSTPTAVFPITGDADTSSPNGTLIAQLYTPVFNGPLGAKPETDYPISLASGPPTPSNGDKTFTIHLKSGLKWSNGDPVTSNDVLFCYYLLKAAVTQSTANWANYTPGQFPLDVTSASAPNATTVVFNLNAAYNPGYFLNNNLQDTNFGLYALPSKVWDIDKAGGPALDYTNPANALKIFTFLNTQGQTVSTFATNPLWKVVDGPYKLTSFSTTNSSYTLTPNATYWGPKAYDSENVETYTSAVAVLNALKSGSLDVGGIPATDLPQVALLKRDGYTTFGGPSWGWFGGIINFKDKTDDFGNVIHQEYVRAAIDHLMNQAEIIKHVYGGAAVPQYGPIPSSPTSPYAPPSAFKATYAFSPSTAVSLLKSHGWDVVPGGTTTCADPGTASDECGAGIPKGTPIKFVWADLPTAVSPTSPLEAESLTSEAEAAAGIVIKLQTQTFNFLISNYNDVNPAAKAYTNDWGVNNYGGLFMDFYPTQEGVEDPGAGFNSGDYNDPTANTLMLDSVHSANLSAVKTEATYFAKNPPVFYFPMFDLLSVVSNKVGGTPDSFLNLSYQTATPQFWYLKKSG
jgi:peptide/nickel transport system substrate-binding protein